jgi:hypothetical protein
MIAIVNINDTIFTLNGIRYFKNFAPIARGNKIALVCVYDSRLVLSDWLDFSEYSVNGSTFANVALTVQEIIPVVYVRNIEGGGGGNLTLQQVTTNGNTTNLPIITPRVVTRLIGSDEESQIELDDLVYEFRSSGNSILKSRPVPADLTHHIATEEWVNANAGSVAIVVSANTTASNDKLYHVIANATFTDPTPPVAGKGYTVFVRNGTATIGSVAYTEGTTIKRVWHSGAWRSYVYRSTQRYIDINSNTTLDDTFHNTIVRFTGSCAITTPTGLRADFTCFFRTLPAVTVDFVSTNINVANSDGLQLRPRNSGAIITQSANTYILIGDFI